MKLEIESQELRGMIGRSFWAGIVLGHMGGFVLCRIIWLLNQ